MKVAGAGMGDDTQNPFLGYYHRPLTMEGTRQLSEVSSEMVSMWFLTLLSNLLLLRLHSVSVEAGI